MRHRVLYPLGLVVLGLVAVGASPANAQTVAPGPYYATPSWDQTSACTTAANCPRFIVLSNFSSQAVLDRETGLVWQRSPSNFTFGWVDAAFFCMASTVGGRKSWRLPSVHELASLIDPSASNPALPAGHPFTNVHSDDPSRHYWSASSWADDPSSAWTVGMNDGEVHLVLKITLFTHFAWCVRGGGPLDTY